MPWEAFRIIWTYCLHVMCSTYCLHIDLHSSHLSVDAYKQRNAFPGGKASGESEAGQ